MKRLHIILRGEVQGVGFRYFAQTKAHALGLAGWVRNLPDGTVEIEVQGNEDDLERFRGVVRQGPGAAYVEDAEVEEVPMQDDAKDFRIRY